MSTNAGQSAVTAEQAAKLYPDQRWEIIRGELIMMTPAGYRHGRIANKIAYLVTHHVLEHGLGEVVGPATGFYLERSPDTLRAPDTAFVGRARLDEMNETGFAEIVPDLAVEVVSPSDSPSYVEDKARMWIDHGVKLVWVVWPQTRSISVHRGADAPAILHDGDELTGGEVLPEFRCDVSAVFD